MSYKVKHQCPHCHLIVVTEVEKLCELDLLYYTCGACHKEYCRARTASDAIIDGVHLSLNPPKTESLSHESSFFGVLHSNKAIDAYKDRKHEVEIINLTIQEYMAEREFIIIQYPLVDPKSTTQGYLSPFDTYLPDAIDSTHIGPLDNYLIQQHKRFSDYTLMLFANMGYDVSKIMYVAPEGYSPRMQVHGIKISWAPDIKQITLSND